MAGFSPWYGFCLSAFRFSRLLFVGRAVNLPCGQSLLKLTYVVVVLPLQQKKQVVWFEVMGKAMGGWGYSTA